MFNFPNGTSRAERVTCLSTGNDVFGTRNYRVNATRQSGDTKGGTSITFTGPGRMRMVHSPHMLPRCLDQLNYNSFLYLLAIYPSCLKQGDLLRIAIKERHPSDVILSHS